MKLRAFRVLVLICLGLEAVALAQTTAPPVCVSHRQHEHGAVRPHGHAAAGWPRPNYGGGSLCCLPAAPRYTIRQRARSLLTGSMGTARGFHTATLLQDGRVLITGGENGSGQLSSAEVYDPATGTFAATGSMGTARYGHTATLLQDGRVLMTGRYERQRHLSQQRRNLRSGERHVRRHRQHERCAVLPYGHAAE